MIKRISFFIDFGNAFILIFLNISDIKLKEDLNINKLENFNINVQIYLVFEGKYEEFIVIRVNFSIVKKDDEEYLYNKNDLYFEFNNIGYYSIIQINYIYNYYIFYLGSKTTNNFFPKVIFRFIKKIYKKKETRYWIFITKTTMYKIFIPLSEYPLIYIKEDVMLKGYQEPFYLEYYLKKTKK